METILNKAKRYDEAIERAKEMIKAMTNIGGVAKVDDIQYLFPELKESEDEQHRRWILEYLYDGLHKSDEQFKDQFKSAISWLEKQCTQAKLSEEEQNRFAKGVLTSCALSFIDYLDAHKYEGKMCVSNGECEDIENAFHNAMWDRLNRYYCKYIEKQGKNNMGISEATKQELDDNLNEALEKETPESWNEFLEKQGEQKPVDKVEPKFKVKYAGSEYNVLEVKDIAGVTYYEIEDEPNHIDYVQAKNCEIVDGYSIKESGSPYPTKPAVFLEQKSAWSEEDERIFDNINLYIRKAGDYPHFDKENIKEAINWLKFFKNRVFPQPKQEWSEEDEEMFDFAIRAVGLCKQYAINHQVDGLSKLPDTPKRYEELQDWIKYFKDRYTWKPSDEQIKALDEVYKTHGANNVCRHVLFNLMNDLKKLREE